MKRARITTRVTIAAWALSFAFAVAPAPTEAQSVRGLRGITSVFTVIEDPNKDAQSCGVSEPALDSAVRKALASSNLKFAESRSRESAYITVATSVIKLPIGCIGAVRVGLMRWSSEFETTVGVWHEEGLLTGQPKEFGTDMSVRVQQFADSLVVAWRKANP